MVSESERRVSGFISGMPFFAISRFASSDEIAIDSAKVAHLISPANLLLWQLSSLWPQHRKQIETQNVQFQHGKLIISIIWCGMKLFIHSQSSTIELMNKWFHPTLCWACDYLSMLGLKLSHVNKRTPLWWHTHTLVLHTGWRRLEEREMLNTLWLFYTTWVNTCFMKTTHS